MWATKTKFGSVAPDLTGQRPRPDWSLTFLPGITKWLTTTGIEHGYKVKLFVYDNPLTSSQVDKFVG